MGNKQIETRPFKGMGVKAIAEYVPETSRPPSLYHYTNAQGLLSIIKKGTFRFSDTRFLNDGSEVQYGLDVFCSSLREFMEDKPQINQERAELLKVSVCDRVRDYKSFVFCMSEEGNLLNQWRDYGKDAISYSLELNTKLICDNANFKFSATPFKMIYDPVIQKRAMLFLIKSMYEKWDTLGPIEDDTVLQDISDHAFTEITWLIYQFKNPAFTAEMEWRLLSFSQNIIGRADLGFRPSALGVVPYFDRQVTDGRKLPITAIKIGPSPYSEISKVALDEFLLAEGYNAVVTDTSIIPLRR